MSSSKILIRRKGRHCYFRKLYQGKSASGLDIDTAVNSEGVGGAGIWGFRGEGREIVYRKPITTSTPGFDSILRT